MMANNIDLFLARQRMVISQHQRQRQRLLQEHLARRRSLARQWLRQERSDRRRAQKRLRLVQERLDRRRSLRQTLLNDLNKLVIEEFRRHPVQRVKPQVLH